MAVIEIEHLTKTYVRDSGLLHRLLNIPDLDALEGHPVVGRSWEGFVMENVLAHLSTDWQAYAFQATAPSGGDPVFHTRLTFAGGMGGAALDGISSSVQ